MAVAALCACGPGTKRADPVPAPAPPDSETADVASTDLPANEAEAPSGVWTGIRYLTEEDSSGRPAGVAQGRRYDITASCDDDAPCVLTLGPVNGSFLLPEVDPGDANLEPLVLTPDDGQWTGATTEFVRCTKELDGDYLAKTSTFELRPERTGGAIVSLAGTVTVEEELTPEGTAAGCPPDSPTAQRSAMTLVDDAGLGREFEVDGSFLRTLQVATAEGYSADDGQPGYVGITPPERDVRLSGSCVEDECTVTRTAENVHWTSEVELTKGKNDEALSGSEQPPDGCIDEETGEDIIAEGAYNARINYTLWPVLVEDGKAKVLLGAVEQHNDPTDLARESGDGRCDQRQAQLRYEFLVARDHL